VFIVYGLVIFFSTKFSVLFLILFGGFLYRSLLLMVISLYILFILCICYLQIFSLEKGVDIYDNISSNFINIKLADILCIYIDLIFGVYFYVYLLVYRVFIFLFLFQFSVLSSSLVIILCHLLFFMIYFSY